LKCRAQIIGERLMNNPNLMKKGKEKEGNAVLSPEKLKIIDDPDKAIVLERTVEKKKRQVRNHSFL
jgi:hypothetical protein